MSNTFELTCLNGNYIVSNCNCCFVTPNTIELAAEENTEIHIRFAIVMLFSALCFHRDPISLIERAPRWSQYNDTYKDYLGKPRENNVRSARPKREKIQERLHGHIPNSNATQEYTKCILPIVHGSSAEQLACQVHRSQSATTTPLAATPLCGHPPTIWEGLPTEWGLRVSGAS